MPMLIELRIKNFAIIDNLSVVFGPGLNVFTGETGAGKSIIIDAISLVLGDRASNDVIRTLAEEAEVEALFDLSGVAGAGREIKNAMEEAGITFSDHLIIKRVIQKAGRNKIYINGSLATLVTLTEAGRRLIDICGQSEHQSLTRPEEHVEALDAFGSLQKLRDEMAEAHKGYTTLKKEHDALLSDSNGIAGRRDMLVFQSREISDASLRPGMEAELAKERDRLKNAEKIRQAAENAEKTIYSEHSSVVERLGAVLKQLKEVSALDERLGRVVASIETAAFQLEDAGTFLRDYHPGVESDPDALDALGGRLDLINRLKKKYGATVEAVIDKKAEIDRQLSGLTGIEERIKTLEGSLKAASATAVLAAERLSAKRREAAKALKLKIEEELKGLGMKAVFEARVEGDAGHDGALRFGAKGGDRVSFYISVNPGEELRPLSRVASGGELSRIMLAMKKATAAGRVSTIVFDEIDAGIGGTAAQAVGLKLKEVSRNQQTICITHLPQIAAFADAHYAVSKETDKAGRTSSSVKALGPEERVEAISRMLGGAKVTDAARQHAVDLIDLAGKLSKKK